MAKTPKTPAKAKKSNKAGPKGAKVEDSELYTTNKDAIEKALEQCTGHLKKLEPSVAMETIKRLQQYYINNGVATPRNPG